MDTTVSRRNLLRAGAVGGALVWAVPAVQLLGGGRAFAASGSAPVTPPATPPRKPTTPGKPTEVLGETFTKKSDPASTVSDPGTTASSALPFTGAGLPVGGALEAGVGLVAGGAVLRALARRGRDADADFETDAESGDSASA